MGRRSIIAACVVAALALSITSNLIAQEPETALTEKETIELIKQNKRNLKDAAAVLERRGVDFEMDLKIEKALRKAGADDETVQDVVNAGPAARASRMLSLETPTGAQIQVSPKEGLAIQAMQNELDPNRRVLMMDEFEREFPKSPLLSHVYAQGAKAYQEKGDHQKAVEFGEKSLKLDPDNLPALLVISISITQPSMLRSNESEKIARLAEAQGDADHALRLLGGMSKHGVETDEQFLLRKRGLAADAHFALGMVVLLRDDPAQAVEEFKNAISSSPNPTPQYYFRLGDAYSSAGKTDDAIASFKQAAELGKGTAIEQMAEKRIADLKKRTP